MNPKRQTILVENQPGLSLSVAGIPDQIRSWLRERDQRLVEVIPLAIMTPKNNPLLSRDTDPTSNCRRKPIAIYEGPARDCSTGINGHGPPLVQPGSLKEDDPKKSKICQVPAKSAVEKITSASTGKAKSIQITKIHN